MISKFNHRTTGLTLIVKETRSQRYNVEFRRAGKTLGMLVGVGTPQCRTQGNRSTDDDRLAAQAALSFVQVGPCASADEREQDHSLQVWQDLTDSIGVSIYGDRQNEYGEDIFWLRRIV